MSVTVYQTETIVIDLGEVRLDILPVLNSEGKPFELNRIYVVHKNKEDNDESKYLSYEISEKELAKMLIKYGF